MKKYLVTIEFRYTSKREYSSGGNIHMTKTNTIGVFEDFNTACEEGNKILEVLESKYKPNIYADGRVAPKRRFGKNNGAYGLATTLVTKLGYLKTPFDFYAKITTLDFIEINDFINTIEKDLK